MHKLDLYRLLKAYQNVLLKAEDREKKASAIHTIIPYPYTIEGQKNRILQFVQQKNKVSFIEILQENNSKIIVIFNFLAILELLQSQIISLYIEEGFNNFWIEKNENTVLSI
jgi:segregation and condensation protein A